MLLAVQPPVSGSKRPEVMAEWLLTTASDAVKEVQRAEGQGGGMGGEGEGKGEGKGEGAARSASGNASGAALRLEAVLFFIISSFKSGDCAFYPSILVSLIPAVLATQVTCRESC